MSTAPTSLTRRQLPPALPAALAGVLLAAALVAAIVLVARSDGLDLGSSRTIHGSGVPMSQVRTLPPFDAVDLRGANAVSIRVGGEQSVVVNGDDNLVRYVTTRVSGGELRIGQSRGFSTQAPMRVELVVPSLDSLALSGSGILDARGLRGERLSVRVPGSGLLTVAGRVDRLQVSLAGSGDVRLGALDAREARASVAGSGRIQVHVSGRLDASIAGSGAILYSGNPTQVTRTITGAGSIVEQ